MRAGEPHWVGHMKRRGENEWVKHIKYFNVEGSASVGRLKKA